MIEPLSRRFRYLLSKKDSELGPSILKKILENYIEEERIIRRHIMWSWLINELDQDLKSKKLVDRAKIELRIEKKMIALSQYLMSGVLSKQYHPLVGLLPLVVGTNGYIGRSLSNVFPPRVRDDKSRLMLQAGFENLANDPGLWVGGSTIFGVAGGSLLYYQLALRRNKNYPRTIWEKIKRTLLVYEAAMRINPAGRFASPDKDIKPFADTVVSGTGLVLQNVAPYILFGAVTVQSIKDPDSIQQLLKMLSKDINNFDYKKFLELLEDLNLEDYLQLISDSGNNVITGFQTGRMDIAAQGLGPLIASGLLVFFLRVNVKEYKHYVHTCGEKVIATYELQGATTTEAIRKRLNRERKKDIYSIDELINFEEMFKFKSDNNNKNQILIFSPNILERIFQLILFDVFSLQNTEFFEKSFLSDVLKQLYTTRQAENLLIGFNYLYETLISIRLKSGNGNSYTNLIKIVFILPQLLYQLISILKILDLCDERYINIISDLRSKIIRQQYNLVLKTKNQLFYIISKNYKYLYNYRVYNKIAETTYSIFNKIIKTNRNIGISSILNYRGGQIIDNVLKNSLILKVSDTNFLKNLKSDILVIDRTTLYMVEFLLSTKNNFVEDFIINKKLLNKITNLLIDQQFYFKRSRILNLVFENNIDYKLANLLLLDDCLVISDLKLIKFINSSKTSINTFSILELINFRSEQNKSLKLIQTNKLEDFITFILGLSVLLIIIYKLIFPVHELVFGDNLQQFHYQETQQSRIETVVPSKNGFSDHEKSKSKTENEEPLSLTVKDIVTDDIQRSEKVYIEGSIKPQYKSSHSDAESDDLTSETVKSALIRTKISNDY